MLLRPARGAASDPRLGKKLRKKAMKPHCMLLTALALGVLLPVALAAQAATPAPGAAYHRIEVKPPKGAALPYTLEVPQDWQVRQFPETPGLWIGPADAKPPGDARLIWVRGSQVSLAEPDKVVANIKDNDTAHPEWSAPRVEVREVGGVRAVLVQMDSGEGDKARTSLTLKVPFQKVSVDFVA